MNFPQVRLAMQSTRITIIIILFLALAFSMGAKPELEVELIKSFPVEQQPEERNSSVFCIADTLLIYFATMDSTKQVTYTYDFNGNKLDTFNFPADSLYNRFVYVSYLYGSQRIALCNLQNLYIDYYSTSGIPLDSKKPMTDWTMYLNAQDYDSLTYHLVYNLYEAADDEIVTSSMTWYRENPDGEMQPLRKVCSDANRLLEMKGPFRYRLLMDSNRDEMMYLAEENDKEFVVSYPDTIRWNKIRINHKKGEQLARIIAGENFFILEIWKDKFKYTDASGVYNLAGKKILNWSSLEQYDTKGVDIIDIVGDKMFVYDYNNKLIKMYRIYLIANK
jgi:hypothetical protein